MKKPIVLLTLISSLLLTGCGQSQEVDPIDDDTIIDIPDDDDGEGEGEGEEVIHIHSFSKYWMSNETGHWHVCSCGQKSDVESHKFGDWVTDKEPTLTEEGLKHKTCTACSYKVEQTIPVKTEEEHTHTFSSTWEYSPEKHWRECSCGEKTEEADHTFGDWVTDVEPTATVDGSKHQSCTVCGYQVSETIPATGEDPSPTPTGRVRIKIQFHVDSSSKEGIAYQKRVDEFNKAYNGVYYATPIFYARSAGATDYEQQIIAQKTDGTLPDVITFDAPNCASYAYSEILANMTSYFTDEEKEDFLSLNTVLNSEGEPQLYGLPIQESSAGFYYNKKIFADAGINVSAYTVENPWTFAQFKQVCATLKSKGVTAVDMRFDATTDETATYLLYPFIYAAGGEFVSSNGWNATNHFNKTESKNGFKFLKELITSGYTSYSIGATDFFTGKVGMYLSSGWTIPDLDNKYPEQFPNRSSWGLLPYPQDVNKASANGSWSYGMTRNGPKNTVKNKAASIALIKWMSSAESSTVITDATGMIPARISCNPNYGEGSPERVLLDQLASTSRERPVTVGYPNFSIAFRGIIATLRDKDVDASVEAATSELQSQLDEIRKNL